MSETPTRDHALRHALLLLAAAAFFACMALLPLETWVEALREWTAARGALGLAVFAGAYAVLTFFLVPGALLMLAAGLAFGMKGAIPVLAGAALSGVCGFLAGRYFARGPVLRLIARRPRLGAIDEAVASEGWLIALLLRLSGVIPFNLQSLALGATRMRFLPYLLASVAGVTPGTLAYVWAGTLGGAAAEGAGPASWALLAAGAAATLAMVIVISLKARNILGKYGVQPDPAP
jgi:uncharacterized membrane protein YdjX (TVP38/TMEM64 family)